MNAPEKFIGESISFNKLQEEIGPALMRNINGYTTPLFYKGTHRGSAVLVTYRGLYGFLTAHHVVHEAPQLELGESLNDLLQMKVKESGHSFSFSLSKLMEIVVGRPAENRYSENGPDLTFVKLPEGEELGTLKSLKNFYNLDRPLGDPGGSTGEQHCIVSGFPDKLKVSTDWRGEKATAFRELFLFGGFEPDSYAIDGEFDTMTVKVGKEPETEKPTYFGGISGGSVWQFAIEKSKDGSQARVRYPMLSGIVFYQKADDGDDMPIVFHCRRSIETAKRAIEKSAWAAI